MSVAPTATQTRESRAGLLWTALLAAYALVILFPVLWMALMTLKPPDADVRATDGVAVHADARSFRLRDRAEFPSGT